MTPLSTTPKWSPHTTSEQRIQLPWLLSTVLARYRLTDAFSPTMYLAAGVCREMTVLIRVKELA